MFGSLFGKTEEPDAVSNGKSEMGSRPAGDDDSSLFKDANLRIFTRQMKKQCWEKARLSRLACQPERRGCHGGNERMSSMLSCPVVFALFVGHRVARS